MARPRDPAKQQALLTAAEHLIGREGLGAATADIARDSGVAYGTLFAIFTTKAGLLNGVYVHLQVRLSYVARAAMRREDAPRRRLRNLWDATLRWAVSHPDEWRALAHLEVFPDLTADSRAEGLRWARPVLDVLAVAQQHGPLQDAPTTFTFSLMRAMIASTARHQQESPETADQLSTLGFDAFWSAVSPHSERRRALEPSILQDYFRPD